MPPRLLNGFLSTLLATVSFAAEEDATTPFRWLPPDDPAVVRAVIAAEGVADELLRTLSSELSDALAARGPAGAVNACQLKALSLTTAVADAAAPDILAVKRISLKLRNPSNAPDPAEQAALDRVAALIASGAPPPAVLVQHLESDGHPAELRVYRPIAVASRCLACHGDPANFPPALRTALTLRYPEDAATGYREKDWRGLIRISLHPPPLAANTPAPPQR